jgi:ABC-2 type transport system ATP-binding protein
MTLAIETNGLSKSYGPVRAVESVDLRVERGEIYGFVGLNGAGKTTTIRSLLGMVRPDAGSVRVLGQAVGPRALAAGRPPGRSASCVSRTDRP